MTAAHLVSVDEASERVIQASDMNRLLKALGCTHGLVALDGEPFGPYWCHIIDEHTEPI